MLFSRGDDAPICNHWMDGGNVVKAHHEDFAGFARSLDRRYRAEGHAVVAAEDCLEICVLIQHRGCDIVALINFPIATLHADDVESAGFYRLLESKPPLLAVESCRNSFDDGNLVPC